MKHSQQNSTTTTSETSLRLPGSNPTSDSKRYQHTYLDKGGITAQRAQLHRHRHPQQQRQRKAKRPPSEVLQSKKATKDLLLGLLSQLDTTESREVASKIKLCGSKFSVITCGKHVLSKRPMFRCEHRLCPHCAARKAKEKLQKYLPKVLAFLRYSPVPVTPCHLVLTLTHRQGETIKQAKKRLYKAFRKLIRREFWQEHFAGGLYGIEATISETVDENGLWHCHMHLLVFRKKFVDLDELRAEWLAVTGDSFVLRLDRVKDVKSGLVEVLKYITKPSDFEKYTPEHVWQLLQLRGERMFGAFGEFAKFAKNYTPSDNEVDALFERFDFAEGDCCPHCDGPLFEVVLSDLETIGFLKRLELTTISNTQKRELKE